MSYQSIRNQIMKYELLFNVARFFFTPIRVTKELIARRKMADILIEKYSDISQTQKKIFYFGIPEHNNLGDIAQTYCTRKWINENYPERQVIEAKTRATFDRKFNQYLKNILNPQDIIFFQSGYCTRHNNADHLMHLHIAKLFPENTLVILPQTVKMDDHKDIVHTKNVFKKCKKLRFITRDKLSYKMARRFVEDSKLACFPDIVTSLIGRTLVKEERKGILLCVRNDDEKYYSKAEIEGLKKRLSVIFDRVDETDTNSCSSAEKVFENLEQELNNIISEFASYKCIITDRYHGTIFSLVANTPVIVIKTNDHKVTSALDWFEGMFDDKAVRLADSLEEAYEMAKELKTDKNEIQNNSILYEKYYKTALKDLVDSVGRG